MTTPSHHRVHHARNEKYMDQNYGHIFIFWDRLFGTFVEEDEEPDYGITTRYKRSNPFHAVFSYWKDLFSMSKKTKTVNDKINVFVKGPAFIPEDLRAEHDAMKIDETPYTITMSLEKRAYLLFNVVISAASFIGLLYIKSKLGENTKLEELVTNREIVALAGIIAISIFAHSRLIEDKNLAYLTDGIRLVAVVLFVIYGFGNAVIAPWLVPLISIYCFVMLLWLIKLSKKPDSSLSKA